MPTKRTDVPSGNIDISDVTVDFTPAEGLSEHEAQALEALARAAQQQAQALGELAKAFNRGSIGPRYGIYIDQGRSPV